MTPSQLRQWTLQNSQPDQWWLNLDSVTEEIPVTVAEIEERLKNGDYSTVQALHVTQADMENAPWVEVTMPAPPIAYRGTPPVTLPPSSTKSLPPLTADFRTTSPIPAASHAPIGAEGAKNSPIAVRASWVVGSVILLAILYVVYSFAPLLLAGMVFIILLIFGGIAWVRFFPNAPEIVTLMLGVAAIAGFFYGGYKILSTTDLLDGKSLDSVIHRGESRETATSGGNPSGEHTITGDNFTGFSRLEDEERATELASDTEAFGKFFTAGAMSNRATRFKRGETVILEESEGLLSGKVKLRRKGEAVSYWTNREAID